jgi:hypothetical protein
VEVDPGEGLRTVTGDDASPPANGIYAREWLARFRSLYDEAASDPQTALGLFYDRHRRFVAGPGGEPPSRPTYTYEEWNRTLTAFLGGLAREFGLVQTEGWTEVPQLMWYWNGVPDAPAVAIREVNVAGESVVQQDVPSVVRSGALLSVLILYPDFPRPYGTSSMVEANEHWRGRITMELDRLDLDREFLLATISAFDWELPAPWNGFEWRSRERSMAPIR